MYRGTTPMLPLKVMGIDLTGATIYATIMDTATGRKKTFQSGTDFTPTFDGNNTICNIWMTQEETLAMSAGNYKAQVRFIYSDGTAGATSWACFRVKDVLLDEVITYGE